MKPWFNTDERIAALWTEQQRWFGTPFIAHAASHGHGVDCVNLQHEIFANVGAIPRLELPAYSLDYAKHSTRPQLLLFLLTHPQLAGRFVMVAPSGKLAPGDLIGLRSGRVDHHLASVNPWDEAVHAIEEVGVVRTKLNDAKFAARVLYVMRLMEVDAA
ncbi:MAG: hypothetical protein KF715_08680 [Candidatus Didemnitutus sp.]|nr:hypothetical protein [Candidatus Didemnitutus sp.]